MKNKLLSLALVFTMIISIFSVMPITASATEYTSSYYTYTLSNNQATITKVDSSISGAVTVPSSLNGYTVVAIGNSAFQNLTGIKSLKIPNSITTMGEYAFRGCTSMTSVNIGSGLTTISCFRRCQRR